MGWPWRSSWWDQNNKVIVTAAFHQDALEKAMHDNEQKLHGATKQFNDHSLVGVSDVRHDSSDRRTTILAYTRSSDIDAVNHSLRWTASTYNPLKLTHKRRFAYATLPT